MCCAQPQKTTQLRTKWFSSLYELLRTRKFPWKLVELTSNLDNMTKIGKIRQKTAQIALHVSVTTRTDNSFTQKIVQKLLLCLLNAKKFVKIRRIDFELHQYDENCEKTTKIHENSWWDRSRAEKNNGIKHEMSQQPLLHLTDAKESETII